VSGRVAVAEKPDAVWDRPDLERLYARLQDEYEFKERAEALARKLALISETAKVLTDIIATKCSCLRMGAPSFRCSSVLCQLTGKRSITSMTEEFSTCSRRSGVCTSPATQIGAVRPAISNAVMAAALHFFRKSESPTSGSQSP
jgi:hypothetical protein